MCGVPSTFARTSSNVEDIAAPYRASSRLFRENKGLTRAAWLEDFSEPDVRERGRWRAGVPGRPRRRRASAPLRTDGPGLLCMQPGPGRVIRRS
jgi:hypothetical protein